jgi:hypothetical protein
MALIWLDYFDGVAGAGGWQLISGNQSLINGA